MEEDAKPYAKVFEKRQRFAPIIRSPAEDLVPLTSLWPFAQWGMVIMGPMPKASGNRNFLFVATNYFTKWIEEESLARITEPMVEKFVLRNIKFVVQFSIISDIGAKLQKKFRAFCTQDQELLPHASLPTKQYAGKSIKKQSWGQPRRGLRERKKRGKWPDQGLVVLCVY